MGGGAWAVEECLGGKAGLMAYEGERELREVDFFRIFNLSLCPSNVDI